MNNQVSRYEPYNANAYMAGQQLAAQAYGQAASHPTREAYVVQREAHVVNGELHISEREVYLFEGDPGPSWGGDDQTTQPTSWLDKLIGGFFS